MQRSRRAMLLGLPLNYLSIRLSLFKVEPMERFALSWGHARQFTKLLLSLLSHIGEMVGRHGAAPCSAA
jgi:hypothetical protein